MQENMKALPKFAPKWCLFVQTSNISSQFFFIAKLGFQFSMPWCNTRWCKQILWFNSFLKNVEKGSAILSEIGN